jgi:hypothetical protein
MVRIIIDLSEVEKLALLKYAEKEYRDPRAQAALIIRENLEQHGLLPTDEKPVQVNNLADEISVGSENLSRK